MVATELAAFKQFTGRTTPSPSGYFDATLVVGRRGGKSLALSAAAAFLSTMVDWSAYLTGGERATILVLAADKRQAGVIFRYLRSMLDIPAFEGLITRETNELLELGNGVAIEVVTASYRTIRGRTVVAALCDEIAFWRTEDGANPDHEIINALKPSMATVPGARLLKASSPYSRRGVLYADYRKHYGRDESATLVWRATSKDMNPTLSDAFISAAYEDDPSSAAAELGAEFRSDVEAFVSREAVEACVVPGRFEIAPSPFEMFTAHLDPSGGSADSMTIAISTRQDDRAVLCAVREWRPPFSPEEVVAECSQLLTQYRIKTLWSDRYGSSWVQERFFAHSIELLHSKKTTSELYLEFLPLVNSQKCELLDHPRAIGQICALERKNSRTGRSTVSHPPGPHHDDLAAVIAGALVNAVAAKRYPQLLFG
jgi:hypothetical protein